MQRREHRRLFGRGERVRLNATSATINSVVDYSGDPPVDQCMVP